MFYSELLSSPIDTEAVKHTYGVNPDTEPDRARAIGIYPLTEAPAGYSPTHYSKEGYGYAAIPSDISDAEKAGVYRMRAAKISMEEALLKLKLPQTTDLVEEMTQEEPVKKSRKKKS